MNGTYDALMTLDEYKQSLLTSIHIGITATNHDDAYSVGLRNGLRICKAYIDGQEPEYEEVKNDPLTWDELKAMEGKPVWMEYGISFNQKRWVVIHSFHNTGSFCYMDVSGNYPNTFWQKDMGEDEFWQAYRKERK